MKLLIILLIIGLYSCDLKSYTSNSENNNDNLKVRKYLSGEVILHKVNDNLIISKRRNSEASSIVLDSIVIENETGEHLNDFDFFDFDRKQFIYGQIVLDGSSAECYVNIYHIDTLNLILERVEFEYASTIYRKKLPKGKGIWKGEYINFKNNTITSNFNVYNDTDGNCCPTGGNVDVKYKLQNIENKKLKFAYDTMIYNNNEK